MGPYLLKAKGLVAEVKVATNTKAPVRIVLIDCQKVNTLLTQKDESKINISNNLMFIYCKSNPYKQGKYRTINPKTKL